MLSFLQEVLILALCQREVLLKLLLLVVGLIEDLLAHPVVILEVHHVVFAPLQRLAAASSDEHHKQAQQ